MSIKANLCITTPNIKQAADILHLRTTVFREEVALAGVSSEAAIRHTEDWLSPESVIDYKYWMAEKLTDESMHLRVVMLGSVVAGLFVGRTGVNMHQPNDIRVIQLDRTIRGQGVGRALMAEFDMQAANPCLPTSLDVFAGNDPAIGFYTHLGFEEASIRPVEIGGETAQFLTMRKEEVSGRTR